jgi:transglutaminase-like putative cysteine protease
MTALRAVGCLTMILCLCLLQRYCSAQDKSKDQFGKVSPADFTLPANPIIDTNANAVILSDVGSVHFIGNSHSWFSYVYQRQTRIKILNKKAFGDLATVVIPLYREGEDAEQVDRIAASTYNLENGQVVVTKLEKADLFENRLDKNRFEKKFTLPGVKEGSIIEYTYTITSDYDFNLPFWEFQREEYPCLWSEYQVDIPQALYYIMVRQGVHPYVIDKGSEGHGSYRLTSKPDNSSLGGEGDDLNVSANTIRHHWAMKDIPAFHEELYLSTPANYLDKIEFQLAKTYNGEEYRDEHNSWKQTTKELLEQEDFGKPLNDGDDQIAQTVAGLTSGSSDAQQEARAIYYYVSSHFTCNNYYDKYVKTTLRDVMKKNGGSVGDINLLLIAMLRKAGLQADPVVLSTREYGFNLATYPILHRLNYVIARLKADGTIYYLDAAHPQLGFGQLAGNCYNGHARIISDKDSGSVYFETDSLKESKTTLVLISNTDKGMEGTLQSTLGKEESYQLRRRLSSQDQKSYFKDIQTAWGEDMEISNGGIDSLSRLEDPVKVYYDFRFTQMAGASPLYINPMIGEGMRENPFKAAERKYPVEMPYVRDDMYILNMQVPDGYEVDELPKSARVALNGDQGMFEYLIASQGNTIQLRCHLKLKKANFSPDDYSSLRDFFGYVVKKESETIVLKKK